MTSRQKAGDWFSGLEFFGIKLGLEQTRELFHLAGDPDRGLRFLHVAGSNGKGSVCALLDAALRNAGFKTGFYSSPHLVDARERFRVNGRLPSRKTFDTLLEKAKGYVDTMRAQGASPTYFEVTTLLAALHFANEKVDFVLWETGMGGRLDATNIVQPLCSILTSISLEHKQWLGDTLEKIAFEKAGIIKAGAPVFCAELPEEAMAVVEARAAELGSALHRPDHGAKLPRISLKGPCQRANAELCLSVLKWLSGDFRFDLEKALEGFSKTKWPARFQRFPELRTIIDGSHNPEAAEALAGVLREECPGQRFQIILGSFSDKDSGAVLKPLIPFAEEFVFVPVGSSRPSRSPEELSTLLGASVKHRCAESLERALAEPIPDGKLRLVCGSLHLCGEAMALLGHGDDASLEI